MKTTSINSKGFLILVVGLLVLILTGCGSDDVDAFGPAIDEFNLARDNFNDQLDVVKDDKSKFTDPQWVDETLTALSVLVDSAQALRNLPEFDSEVSNRLADLTKRLADTTEKAADAFRAAIDSGDIDQLDNASPYFDQINSLLPQLKEVVERLRE